MTKHQKYVVLVALCSWCLSCAAEAPPTVTFDREHQALSVDARACSIELDASVTLRDLRIKPFVAMAPAEAGSGSWERGGDVYTLRVTAAQSFKVAFPSEPFALELRLDGESSPFLYEVR